MFSCPDVPGTTVRDPNANAGNGLSHYLCHPRLMPAVGNGADLIKNGGSGFSQILGKPMPYMINQVKRSSEIALIFDGALVFNPATNMFSPAGDTPIAGSLDFGAFGGGPTYLLENRYDATHKADDSINMAPYSAAPNQSDVNKDIAANSYNIRFRHMKDTACNALMVDGHVESFKYNPNLTMSDPRVTTMKRRNIHVNLIQYPKP
jgi:prepilin-type processing-associated H-X9-DG protein